MANVRANQAIFVAAAVSVARVNSAVLQKELGDRRFSRSVDNASLHVSDVDKRAVLERQSIARITFAQRDATTLLASGASNVVHCAVIHVQTEACQTAVEESAIANTLNSSEVTILY